MVDLTAQGVIGSLSAAVKLLQSLKDTAGAAKVKPQLIELYDIILAGQSIAFEDNLAKRSLFDRIRELEEELTRAKAWEEQKTRYKLVSPWEDAVAVVYALKASCKDSEPAHWICTKCYDDGRRTILQPREDKNGYALLSCPTCKSEIHSGYRSIAPATYAID